MPYQEAPLRIVTSIVTQAAIDSFQIPKDTSSSIAPSRDLLGVQLSLESRIVDACTERPFRDDDWYGIGFVVCGIVAYLFQHVGLVVLQRESADIRVRFQTDVSG